MQGSAVFNGVFELQDGVRKNSCPRSRAFYEHFIEMGFRSCFSSAH